jgi:hypothetical protein
MQRPSFSSVDRGYVSKEGFVQGNQTEAAVVCQAIGEPSQQRAQPEIMVQDNVGMFANQKK